MTLHLALASSLLLPSIIYGRVANRLVCPDSMASSLLTISCPCFFPERKVFNTLRSIPAVLDYIDDNFGITMTKDEIG